jgi:hypothetical protein
VTYVDPGEPLLRQVKRLKIRGKICLGSSLNPNKGNYIGSDKNCMIA